MKSEKLIATAYALALVSLTISCPIWWAWCWVLPQVWPSGPKNFIAPPFWVFYAMIFLVNIIYNWLTPSKT